MSPRKTESPVEDKNNDANDDESESNVEKENVMEDGDEHIDDVDNDKNKADGDKDESKVENNDNDKVEDKSEVESIDLEVDKDTKEKSEQGDNDTKAGEGAELNETENFGDSKPDVGNDNKTDNDGQNSKALSREGTGTWDDWNLFPTKSEYRVA